MKRKDAIQVIDGQWFRVPSLKWWVHGCCDCMMIHDVSFKLVKGKLYSRWVFNKAETRYWRRRLKVTK